MDSRNEILTDEIRANRRLGDYYVSKLRHLEREYQHADSYKAEIIREFDKDWDHIEKNFNTLSPLYNRDTQITEICAALPIAANSLFEIRMSPEQRVEWLLIGIASIEEFPKWSSAFKNSPAPPQIIAWRKRAKYSALNQEMTLHGELGNTYLRCQNHQAALSHYKKAINIAGNLDNARSHSTYLGNAALILAEMGKYNAANQLHHESYQLASEIGNIVVAGNQLRSVGTNFVEAGEFSKGIDYLEQAVSLHISNNSKREIAEDLSELGLSYVESGMNELGLSCLQKALKIANELKYTYLQEIIKQHMSKAFLIRSRHLIDTPLINEISTPHRKRSLMSLIFENLNKVFRKIIRLIFKR